MGIGSAIVLGAVVHPPGIPGTAIAATYDVETFDALPLSPTEGQLMRVTAAPGIDDLFVRYDSGVWLVEVVRCDWSELPADGEWYDAGGITVQTRLGAAAYMSGSTSVTKAVALWRGTTWAYAGNPHVEAISGLGVDNSTLVYVEPTAADLELLTVP